MPYDHLRFRRQFLITPNRCEALEHWQQAHVGSFNIYAHPDLELSVVESIDNTPSVAALGYLIDPAVPERTTYDILKDIQTATRSVDEIADYLFNIAGRFALLVSYTTETFAFHDACGLRAVCYTKTGTAIHLGSQPFILGFVTHVECGSNWRTYRQSEYARTEVEHWLPSGLTLLDDVFHLVPNHCLRLSTTTQVRYWPKARLNATTISEAAPIAAKLLRDLVTTAHRRFPLALSLTAGLDSRTVLSASQVIAHDVYFYTLQYRHLTASSFDLAIPRDLLKFLGYEHHVIDCRRPTDQQFVGVYEQNTPMAHTHDWGEIAYGMLMGGYPQERIAVKGNCSETCRCFYYKSGEQSGIESSAQLVAMTEPGWEQLPFIRRHLANWYTEAKAIADTNGVELLDLFYWEHRMGSWQAQSQLEWDIVQEAYTPFNHRGLIVTLLSVDAKYRCAPHYLLHQELCKLLWPEVLDQPVNPSHAGLIALLKRSIDGLGLGNIARRTRSAFTRARS